MPQTSRSSFISVRVTEVERDKLKDMWAASFGQHRLVFGAWLAKRLLKG